MPSTVKAPQLGNVKSLLPREYNVDTKDHPQTAQAITIVFGFVWVFVCFVSLDSFLGTEGENGVSGKA